MSDTPNDERTRLEELEREVERGRLSRDAWTIGIFGVSGLALLASAIGVGFAWRAIDESKVTAPGGGGGETIDASLTEFAIDLSAEHVGPGGRLAVSNDGSMVHNLAVRDHDLVTADLNAGASEVLDLSSLAPGSYELFCTIPGHAEAGMTTTLHVGDDGTVTSGEAAGHGDHANMTEEEAAALDQRMVDSIMAFPAETEGRGNQLLEPEILPDGTKRYELTASIVDWEVSPGKVVQAWAYNGMVPGPQIRVDVGDTLEVEFHNELPIGSDIHWHGIDVPNDQDGVAPLTQDIVPSGGSHTYRFTVTEPAVSMYHAHAHGHEAVPNGLFGTIFVGEVPMPTGQTVSGIAIPEDLTLAQDFPMVLNDAGVIGLTLDGKSFPATEPVVAKVGDWIRVTYYNEGLQVHPMHLHGFEQIVVAKDGEPLDHPYAADTILISPGERYTVLINPDQVGTWVWHCHILNHVESSDGMFGMVTAMIVS